MDESSEGLLQLSLLRYAPLPARKSWGARETSSGDKSWTELLQDVSDIESRLQVIVTTYEAGPDESSSQDLPDLPELRREILVLMQELQASNDALLTRGRQELIKLHAMIEDHDAASSQLAESQSFKQLPSDQTNDQSDISSIQNVPSTSLHPSDADSNEELQMADETWSKSQLTEEERIHEIDEVMARLREQMSRLSAERDHLEQTLAQRRTIQARAQKIIDSLGTRQDLTFRLTRIKDRVDRAEKESNALSNGIDRLLDSFTLLDREESDFQVYLRKGNYDFAETGLQRLLDKLVLEIEYAQAKGWTLVEAILTIDRERCIVAHEMLLQFLREVAEPTPSSTA